MPYTGRKGHGCWGCSWQVCSCHGRDGWPSTRYLISSAWSVAVQCSWTVTYRMLPRGSTNMLQAPLRTYSESIFGISRAHRERFSGFLKHLVRLFDHIAFQRYSRCPSRRLWIRCFLWAGCAVGVFAKPKFIFCLADGFPAYWDIELDTGFFFRESERPTWMPLRSRATGHLDDACFCILVHFL